MPAHESDPATIVIVAEDRLASLLHDWLIDAGYQVFHTDHERSNQQDWQPGAADLLIGEVRYPAADSLHQILRLRGTGFEQPPPLLLLGAASILPQLELTANCAWMATPVAHDLVLRQVAQMLTHRTVRRREHLASAGTGGILE